MSTTEIGRRLKNARLNACLTQKEVADRLDITYQAISNYERGINRVDTDTLTMLCQIYGIRISDLISTPAWDDDMLDAYHNASTGEEKAALIKLWGTPSVLMEEENNRREPETAPLSPNDECVLYKYHRGELLADLTAAEIDFIKKFRRLDQRGQSAVLNTLEHEYAALPGEKAHTTAKNA